MQSEVERALARVADHPVAVTAAGRTDAGVHARMQVIHFDSDAIRTPRAWVLGANTVLPDEIAVLWARAVPVEFHARYSALSRSYEYCVVNQAARPALLRQRACWVRQPLDAGAMHDAAQVLLGEHDFSSFRAAECQSASPVRRLTRIAVERRESMIQVTVQANAFLHHMVRNIVGSLVAVGSGRQPRDWIAALLAGRDRRLAGATAPPQGLVLAQVEYPAELGLPPPGDRGPCPDGADV